MTFRPMQTLSILVALMTTPATGNAQQVEIEILLDQKVTASTGLKLSLNVFKPAATQRLPTVLMLTPYNLEQGYEYGPWFAKHGYNFVRADIRGRGNSEGEFNPDEAFGMDGADIVQWIAGQPWSDGQVGMFGGSYEGLSQWQTLMGHPPALKTIIPLAAAYPGAGSATLAYQMQWLASIIGRIQQNKLFVDWDYWNPLYYWRYAEHIPWARLPELTHSDDRTWKKWLSHPNQDAYWDSMVPSPDDYAKIDIPILTVTSYYDLAQSGALSFYRNHMRYGPESGKRKHYVLLGPWSHGGTMRPSRTLSGLDFGPASVPYTDMKEYSLQWYDWVMKGGSKPAFLQKAITYYMMEENSWKYADRLEDISDSTAKWYLESQNTPADDVFRSGTLQPGPVVGKQDPDQFTSDPLKLISHDEYFARPPNILSPNWLTDGSPAYEPNTLIYHSPPLTRYLDVAGNLLFRAYIELNVPDTDIKAWLFEVRPDGNVIWLAESFVRARYRRSRAKPELVTPGVVEQYEIPFHFVARRIPAGSRVRLIVGPMNHPNWFKNYNSGGDVAWETAKDARTAVVKVYHDERYPSVVVLPVRTSRAR